ncbi:MAG: hypothetical protein JWR80_6621 [Bradyrhizobium sp.]|jgi:hypothetical protein|nr:hypothetical protein [Bradyrhizobium sp.]
MPVGRPSNTEQRTNSRASILQRYRTASSMRGNRECLFERCTMSQSQPLSSIIPLTGVERPACPECQDPMMLTRIVPAFSGTDLLSFECTWCNHVLDKLAACEVGASWLWR